MTLTKEIIEREMRIWERNGYIEGTVWARHYIDLCRLALLGLERDTRSERIGKAVIAWVGDDNSAQLRTYASDLEADQWPVGADLIRDIAAAMEDSDD